MANLNQGKVRLSDKAEGHVTRGILLAMLGALCWGFSATCASFLMTRYGVDTFWLVSVRVAVAGPVFLVAALIADRKNVKALVTDPKMLLQAVVFALAGVIFMQYSYTQAVRYAGAGNALLLEQVGLVVIVLYNCVRKKRLPTIVEITCLALALLGTAAIATQGNLGQLGIQPLGLLWGMLAALSVAGYNIIPTRLLAKHGSLATNGVCMSIGALIMVPIVRPFEAPVTMPADGWVALAGVIVLGTFVAYVAYLQGVKEAGPVKAGLIGVFEPVSAMVLSFVWLGDAITPFDLIGAVLIIAMMILVSKAGN